MSAVGRKADQVRRNIGGCQAPVMRSCCPRVPVRNVTPASRFLSRSGATQFFVHGIKAADAAQNAHDIKAVESLLLGSPNFLGITRGMPVWGHAAALKRFTALYEGTWRLDPEASDLKITMVADGVAQVYLPINFTIGAAGQPPHQTRFLMNQMLVKTPDGWRVSSILPIPAPTQ
jgi:hypothetical protein